MNETTLFILFVVGIAIGGIWNFRRTGGVSMQALPEIITLSQKDFFDELSKDSAAVLVDVRSIEEYQEGHLRNAVMIDFRHDDFKEKISAYDKNETYFLYCRSGNRSMRAAELMQKMGFIAIYNLKGGLSVFTGELEK